MFSGKPSVSKCRGRSARATWLLTVGVVVLGACSGEDPPANPNGGAGNPSTTVAGTSNAGSAGSSGVGGMGVAGTSSASGANQGGSTAGGSSTAGSAGSGGTGGVTGGAGGSTGGAGTGGTGGVVNGPFELKSSAFKEGEQIPLTYKCAQVVPKGQNISPPLSWGPGPTGTKSYAVVLMHVPSPEHWVLWDIPANVTSLPENIEHQAQPAVPAGSKQSLVNLDGFMGSGYLGPCPQAPNSVQSYQFTLYALDVDTVPGLTATSSPTQAATAVKAHLVAGSQGVSLTGTQVQAP
jgi:Raf kinase inhibitor-like YbhB/YbcL family protein